MATAFSAFSEFLSQSCCRRCQVLEICLTRLRDDLLDRDATASEDLLRELQRTVPFPATHPAEDCSGRCGPAQIFMAYLTPGADIPLPKPKDHAVGAKQE
ncbi:MAG: hypothetical protein HOP18_11105 [Deltaproteobacteria bacterium]|nr:hypothetical protein [Deltaproteobacteria bacterium]